MLAGHVTIRGEEVEDAREGCGMMQNLWTR